ncbi:MAG: hypothetical protein WCT05_12665 [Lentisphaeria bacterium]
MTASISITVARILGLLYLSVAIGSIFRKDYFRDILKSFSENALLAYFSGFIALVLGGLLVHLHNEWTTDWTVLITIVGWIALLKGIVLLAYPNITRLFLPLLLLKHGLSFIPWLCAALGLCFCYFGFFA